MSEMCDKFAKASGLIKAAGRILISGHLSPDGDSLGSMIALSRMLRAAGHAAFATADVHALGKPGFLEGVEDLIPLRKLRHRKFDLFVYVDAASPSRLPPEVRPFAEKLPTIVIDHHATSEPKGVSILDPAASSAGELVWRFAKWMEWPFDRATAEALWVAIVTDSGRFAYDSTRTGTLRAAADRPPQSLLPSESRDPLRYLSVSESIPLPTVKYFAGRLGKEALPALLSAFNTRPPLGLRVNTQRTTREALLSRLASAGHAVRPDPLSPCGLLLDGAASVPALPGFAEGLTRLFDKKHNLPPKEEPET